MQINVASRKMSKYGYDIGMVVPSRKKRSVTREGFWNGTVKTTRGRTEEHKNDFIVSILCTIWIEAHYESTLDRYAPGDVACTRIVVVSRWVSNGSLGTIWSHICKA